MTRSPGFSSLSCGDDYPSSVKLRAEADAELLKTGTGRFFLGFYPDPIHGVHWNNLTEPMKYSRKTARTTWSSSRPTSKRAQQPRLGWNRRDIRTRSYRISLAKTDTLLAGELDQWGGHCGRADDYHYHIAPIHLEKIVGAGNPVAIALDGYPIYGYDDPRQAADRSRLAERS